MNGLSDPPDEHTEDARVSLASSLGRPGSPVAPLGSAKRSLRRGVDFDPGDGNLRARNRRGPTQWVLAATIAILAIAAGGFGIERAVDPGRLDGSPVAQRITPAPPSSRSAGPRDSGLGNSRFGDSGSRAFGFDTGNTGSPAIGGPSGETGPAVTPKDVSAIAAKVDPALVDINSTFAFQRAGGAGTGIVISARGEVITNNHVIDGATRIRVTDVGNGQTYKAVVMGYDPIHDIAVLQMKDASGLATAPLGDSSNLTVGAPVVAIGNALGSGGAPTSASGVITALHQSISASDEIDGMTEQLSGLIEVNANVQSGDSGGSLVDAGGKVIGMDVAALTGSGFQNRASAGYAILINQVLSVVRRIESGKPTRVIHVGPTAFLGILIATPSILGSGGFGNVTTPKSTGVVVSRAVTKGPAALAGIGNGDIVTSLAGQQVDSPASLLKVLIPRHPNDKVVVDWTGPTGVSHRSLVTLGSGPPA